MDAKKVWRRITIFIVLLLGFGVGYAWIMLKDDIALMVRTMLIIIGCFGLVICIIGWQFVRMGKHARIYTRMVKGVYTGPKHFALSDKLIGYYFEYTVDGEDYRVATTEADCITEATPAGTEVEIWYKPDEPDKMIVTNNIRQYGKSGIAWAMFIGGLITVLLGIYSFITL